MRILHIVHSDAFYGVERYIATLATAQSSMGDDVAVVGGSPVTMHAELRAQGVRFSPGGSLSDLARGLRRFRDADVIHTHMTDAELVAVSTRAMLNRTSKVVTTRHFAQHRGASRIGSLAAPLIAAGLDGQISISRFVADRIEGCSTVILPGVPTPTIPAVEREPSILVAQRLEKEKSTDVALRAFAGSGLADLGWRIRFAGDGALRTELESLATTLGVAGSAEFMGRRDDVPQLMASSSILLASAPAEPFGLTVVEAMAAGLPVVAAVAGGHAESLPQQELAHGFEPGDVAVAAASMRELASDPALRDALSEAGRLRHRDLLTPQIQAEQTRAFYTKVVEARR
ncbi:glycosyltransferase family 4 protein [Micropruina glycogenica]|uniref:D-inositol 3-phosphate glycosyltransferase n=1 Tax=Micropruina glycogenica TaxID=75385 RepID=A0A2N9JA93_9ACTN|nr:glycosyltransferase family 4 protein [Micropruina glycogenica]SPD85121.1 conserved protein of unknown function [Micropruina glycogenica]